MNPVPGVLAALGPTSVLDAVALVREGLIIDLSVPLDCTILPIGDPAFNEPLIRSDVMTPAEWLERVDSGRNAFHLDAFGGSIHQGTHIDGLSHVVSDGRVWGGDLEAEARSDRGWSAGGIETVPPIVTRGVLIDLVADRGGRPLIASEEISVSELNAAIQSAGTSLRTGDAVLVRTGKIRDLDHARDNFLDAQPGIGLAAAIRLADAGMIIYGSDTGGTEPQPIRDWGRTVHVELLGRRGIHLLEWLDLDQLATELAERGRTDFLLVVIPLRIVGATGSWVRPIAIL